MFAKVLGCALTLAMFDEKSAPGVQSASVLPDARGAFAYAREASSTAIIGGGI